MNKAMLIDKIAEEVGLTKVTAAEVLDTLADGIVSALKQNQRVTLSGFGSWNVGQRKARQGVNPRTGEAIRIGARKTVRFKPGKQLQEAINGRH